VAEFLVNQGIKHITAHDFCEEKDFEKNFNSFHDWMNSREKKKAFLRLKRLPIKFRFKDYYLIDAHQADLIFVPQSWFRYKENEKLKRLKNKIPFSSISKLYFQLCPCPIIGITGTSGKSTTSRLIYEILKKGHFQGQVYFSGNDRQNVQVLDQIPKMKLEDVLVLEISNRQLMIDLGKSPYISVITNISPNHIDDHGTYKNYIETKEKILKYQTRKDFAVLNYDNKITRDFAKDCKAQVFLFSSEELDQGAFLREKDIIIKKDNKEYLIASADDLRIPGPHNIENVLAASLATFLFGINTKVIREAVIEFKGLKHRLEFVRELDGVKYYEDSSACNPDGPRVAVETFHQPKILIAGGSRKKPLPNEFDKMAEAIVKYNTKALLLIGKMADLIEKAVQKKVKELNSKGLLIKSYSTLGKAVFDARAIAAPGDVVILSPGCESFGMFKDYRARGNQFKKLVKELK
jgi:UDP-N-acetylmuramoylalanine--D-glutamate ligase